MSLSQNANRSVFKDFIRKKIIEPGHLAQQVQEIKKMGKRIATLNGSFDLFHAGHLEIIYQASLQADCLLLALNSDESIKRYKSPLRPIIPLEYRLQMIAALEMVHFVTWFDETDPREVLKKIQPHVHVNGAEYGKNCIEAEVVESYGGRLHLVERLDGLATSEIIKKVMVCG
ncbi:MAG TPA: adenylyltransferase/cytidyltransferase family protein [Rhabdochlamydiaceae bacterium]|nr:adenylyltransferase/cytidyltransferase family protein [Rhabdochlamydiaceae bacterium]